MGVYVNKLAAELKASKKSLQKKLEISKIRNSKHCYLFNL